MLGFSTMNEQMRDELACRVARTFCRFNAALSLVLPGLGHAQVKFREFTLAGALFFWAALVAWVLAIMAVIPWWAALSLHPLSALDVHLRLHRFLQVHRSAFREAAPELARAARLVPASSP